MNRQRARRSLEDHGGCQVLEGAVIFDTPFRRVYRLVDMKSDGGEQITFIHLLFGDVFQQLAGIIWQGLDLSIF